MTPQPSKIDPVLGGGRLQRISRVDEAERDIREAILTGQLKPGMPFKVNELAARFGTSVVPVREALQRLAAVGLVDLRPGRSAVVSALGAEDLLDIYAVRSVLEGDAIKRAVPELTAADIEDLSKLIAEMDGLELVSEDFWSRARRFHELILGPVLTPRLKHSLDSLWEATELYTRLVYYEIGADEDHPPDVVLMPIVEALKAGDPEAARTALLEHYEVNLTWMLRGLSSMQNA